MTPKQIIYYIMSAFLFFTLGFGVCKMVKCETLCKYKFGSHIVETSDYIPSYERDWREKYA